MNLGIKKSRFKGEFEIDINASDKSISHRSCIMALFADSICNIKHFLKAEDTLRTLEICRKLGMQYEFRGEELLLTPPKNLIEPDDILYCGNSGTSMRLLTGLLSGAGLYAVLSGDKYLNVRPMDRVIRPLRDIGANIESRTIQVNGKQRLSAPIAIHCKKELDGFTYKSNISSAQVKSAMILAALFAKDASTYSEISLSRNHTENMLLSFQREKILKLDSNEINITPFNDEKPLNAFEIEIPNDPSSAFFFAVAACILKITIKLKRVMLNDTRIEAFRILKTMGANIAYENIRHGYENIGDIVVSAGELKAVEVSENISWLIDEIPALSIAMSIAKGTSRISNAQELRVKESDRIKSTIEGLNAFGIDTIEHEDGFEIIGGELRYGRVDSKGDHRIAMSFAIASLLCGGEILDCECINTSFPNFLDVLRNFTEYTEII